MLTPYRVMEKDKIGQRRTLSGKGRCVLDGALRIRRPLLLLLAALSIGGLGADGLAESVNSYMPMVLLSDPSGSPPDTLSNRRDPSVASSPFAGSVSITRASDNAVIGSGVAISRRHVLVSAHMLDPNNDGAFEVSAADFLINLNIDGNGATPRQFAAASVVTHPDYTPALQKSACLRGWFEGLEAVQESLFHLPATANRQR